ncbi:MAG: crossover junction endodeoxyribonuclease RuvC [Bryobacteraceae bacterium]|nr:crossover junction endodeoxyribonuclease RuvC [Bryobacteraceae bacterium]
MRILGIDCGSERTGFGVIESDGRRHRMVSCGVIRTRTSDPFEARLLAIAARLRGVIREFEPQAVAVEEVFHSQNSKSALKLAHVRGVALLAAAEAGLPLGEYSPLTIKQSVVGYGRAEKGQVALMVQRLVGGGAVFESADASDAVAIAICHAFHYRGAAAS